MTADPDVALIDDAGPELKDSPPIYFEEELPGMPLRPAMENPEEWADSAKRKRFHRKGIEAYMVGNHFIWIACMCAMQICGRYARGATQAFATDLGRSVDTVEQMAKAALLYSRLRMEFRDASELRYLLSELRATRRRLYYSHFASMWTIWKAHPDMTALDVFGQLQTAAENGTSTRAMERETNGERQDSAIVLPVYGLKSTALSVAMENKDARHIYMVILRGEEWDTVAEVKVRPA